MLIEIISKFPGVKSHDTKICDLSNTQKIPFSFAVVFSQTDFFLNTNKAAHLVMKI